MSGSLATHLLTEARLCVRPPTGGFRHQWYAPMPPLAHAIHIGDGFNAGDYSAGLFAHDASESAIELLRHEGDLREAAVGSLLCLLDAQAPDGMVYRTLLPYKVRDAQPSRPVIAQMAARCLDVMGPEWAAEHRIAARVAAWLGWYERNMIGLHGLFLTHSSLASGFDNDVLTAGLPDRVVEGPDTNAFVVLEYRAMARIERHLGGTGEAWGSKADELRERIERLLWYDDERGGFYVALRWERGGARREAEMVSTPRPAGGSRPLESWLSLLPLYAGIPSTEHADALIRRITDPKAYWGPQGLRTLPRSSPFFSQAARVLHYDFAKGMRGPVSNWCGPTWVLSSFYIAQGLRQYGRVDLAAELGDKTKRMLAHGLAAQGAMFECYADDGRGLWPSQGTFVSWNVLAAGM